MIDKSKTGGNGPRKPFSPDSSERSPRKPAAPRRILQEMTPAAPAAESVDRIAKVMARAGLCSRRDAEQWIEAGRVSVNGVTILSPALNVTAKDQILVDGQPLAAAEPTRLFMFHKPRGTVTTDRDPEGRPTIFEVLPEGLPRVMTIGRLDINTEGLLLLTNDGGLARQLELPTTGWLRRYRVRAHGETDQAVLDSLREGITIDGIHYAGIEAQIDRVQGSNMWLTMGLREGKNREIKRVLEHLGLAVTRLIRVSFGPFQLLELKEGAVEEVKTRVLRDQLSEELIAEAGCIFADESAPAAPRVTAARTASIRTDSGSRPQTRGDRSESRDRKVILDKKPPFERKPRGDISSEQDFTHDYAGELDRPVPGTRKHVKTLRAIREVSERTGPRQTITRDKTQDRNGRSVTVERVARPSIRPVMEPDTRNGKRFAAGNAASEGEAPTGRTRTRRQSDMVREAKAESRAQDPKPFNRGAADKKPSRRPRDEGYDDRPITGRSFEKRQLSARSYQGKDSGAGPSRDSFSKGPRTDARPARSAEGKSFGAKSYGDRPASGKSYGDKPYGDRPSAGKSYGDRPSGGRPSGDRPSGAGGRPSGDRPSGGGRPFGGKPSGGKPFGGKPSGPRGRDR